MRRALWLLAFVSLGLTLVATLWFVARTLPVRIPYWGEAETVYEAARIRSGQPLFGDPLYVVTYPPLFSGVLALVPARAALIVARVLCTLAWFGTLAGIAWTSRKVEAYFAAAFIAGIWVLVNFATIGRPDSIAAAVAAVALMRASRPRKLDLLTVALFVLVPWIKPTFIGLPIGALLAHRDRRMLAIAASLAVTSVIAAYLLTNGEIFRHVFVANAQPFTSKSWLAQVPGRLPFFAPLFAWAAWLGWRARARVGLGALAGATVWTLIALAKTGSSSNYWMEPCIAALVVIARSGPSPRDLPFAAAAVVAVLWTDIAAIRGSLEHAATFRSDAAFVATVREVCPSGTVMADEAGIELVLDGRIVVPTYQFAWLVRRGRVSASRWVDALAASSCYVEHTHQLDLVPDLANERARTFVVTREDAGFRLWARP